MKKKFFIITTVPDSFIFFKGQIQILKQNFDVEMVSSPGKNFKIFCKEEHVIGHKIKMNRGISLIKDIKSLINMSVLFYKKKPAYIHGNTPKAGLISMIAGWILRVPHRIYFIHGLRYEGELGLKKRILIFMEKASCYFASDIFAVSFGIKQKVIKNRITSKKISIIHYGSINGIDCKYFSTMNPDISRIDRNLDFKGNEFVFGYVGRVVADKGINELVSSFIKINKVHNNTKLVLVGPYEESFDPLNNDTKYEINHHPDIIKVDFQNDVRPFYKLFDAFIFPSFREGFGISIIEALAMKLPVVASDISGCNEIISNNVNGILVKKKSINELFLAMNDLVANPIKYQKYANSGRDSVIQKYSQDQVWEKALKAYKKLK